MKLNNKKQLEALYYLTDRETEFVGYGGGAGGGKSYLGCYWLMQMGYYAPGTRYFIGRDSLKDTRYSVLKTWRKLAREIGFTGWRYNDNYIYFNNGSEVEFLDLSLYPQKDPLYERFGSREFTAGWIEEAGPVKELAFDILKTRIGRWLNKEYDIKKKILCTFNPRKNWIDSFFYRPWKKGEQFERTVFVPALAKDNPNLPLDYIITLNNLKDEATRQRLLFGNFDYDDDPTTLIGADAINDLFTNEYVYKEGGKRYITADIAAEGSDKFVIYVWNGLAVIHYNSFAKTTPEEVERIIKSLAIRYNVPRSQIAYDADGLGTYLQSYLQGAYPFKNNRRAYYGENYQNLKSQVYYLLAEYINKGLIYIKCPMSSGDQEALKLDLAWVKSYESDKDNKVRILPKEKVKENIRRSPDFSDALAIRMVFVLMNI